MNAFICPNEPRCPHPGMLHDIYEPGDRWPTCCAEGCRCGHPGTATTRRHLDGTVTVDFADPVIRVSRELAESDLPMWVKPDENTLVLDTAGRYRYHLLRTDPDTGDLIYGRERS